MYDSRHKIRDLYAEKKAAEHLDEILESVFGPNYSREKWATLFSKTSFITFGLAVTSLVALGIKQLLR
jgi:hypothetical protein